MGPGDAPFSQGRQGGNEGGRTVPAWAACALSWLPDCAAQPDSCVLMKLKLLSVHSSPRADEEIFHVNRSDASGFSETRTSQNLCLLRGEGVD